MVWYDMACRWCLEGGESSSNEGVAMVVMWCGFFEVVKVMI